MAVLTSAVNACEANWEDHKADCSGFVKAVASDLGVTLTGQANDIVDQIQIAPWVLLGKDGVAAKQKADAGLFVVAGLRDAPNGHVVVITPGPLDPNNSKYPTGYWGRLHGVGRKATTINWAWDEDHRDNVIYAYTSIRQ